MDHPSVGSPLLEKGGELFGTALVFLWKNGLENVKMK